ERLVEETRAVTVLHADRQVRVQDGGRLPPQELQLAAAPAPRWSEGRPLRLGVSDAGLSAKLGDQRLCEPEPQQSADELATAERARPHPPERLAQLVLVSQERAQPCPGTAGRSDPGQPDRSPSTAAPG